ncbi:MAG: FAD-dependent oxidoreductase [Niabella sp.]
MVINTGRDLPLMNDVDICVLGGSCTGVFAAIRAARLGARVAIVEKQGAFGGVATVAKVNTWHSLRNTDFTRQIIAGLTEETLHRLAKRDAVIDSGRKPEDKKIYRSQEIKTFNAEELKIELDEMVLEAGIIPYLHTLFSEPLLDDEGNVSGVIVDNKSGRGVIRAKYFIDATGDGDLCYRMGFETYESDRPQPPTTCVYLEGWNNDKFQELLKAHRHEFNIPEGYAWGAKIPGTEAYMLAGTRIYGVNCSNADDLTKAEMEGRRQIRAMFDLVRKYGKDFKMGLLSLPATVAIRETRHVKCLYQMTNEDAMTGRLFEDAIANGSYRLDTHHHDKPGLTFKYLDGTEVYERVGYPREIGRWRPETKENPTFYQVPLRSLIPLRSKNIILAGRMLDASDIAFSGVRVMVNMNQTGEAAGVTAFLALQKNIAIPEVSGTEVRETLATGGSIII